MSLFLINPFRFGVVAPEFASLYESFDPLTVIRKQHFLEWFSGQAIDSIWTLTESGTGTGIMDDAVNEGWKYTTGAFNTNNGKLEFNGIGHYLETACVVIWVARTEETALYISNWGLVNAVALNHLAYWAGDPNTNANWHVWTKDGASDSNTASDVADDTNFHNFKIEMNSSNCLGTLDGILKVTKSTNRPAAALEPFFRMQTRTGAAKTAHVRFCEAYNT